MDGLTDSLGRLLSIASLLIMSITFIIVIIRYGFNTGHIQLGAFRLSAIAMQESVIYLHSALFMLASAYTLKHNAHVRVDVFYRNFSQKKKAWVDLFGTLFFLFPMIGFILFTSLDFVAFSWTIQEHSQESEGLPYVYLLKSLIPIMSGMLILQGMIEILRNITVIQGKAQLSEEESKLV